MKFNLSKLLRLIPEGILFYFILVPIFTVSQMRYPFWSYLVIVMITLFLFDAGVKLTKSYLVYLPILLLGFAFAVYGLGYPVAIAILLLGYLFWREWTFEMSGVENNRLILFTLTTVLLLIEVMFFYNDNLIWMGAVQAIVVISGYWLDLTFSAPQSKRAQNKSLLFTLLLLSGGIALYVLYPLINGAIGIIFSVIGFGFKTVVYGIADLLNWAGISLNLDIIDEKSYNQIIDNFKNDMDDLKEIKEAPVTGGNGESGFSIWKFIVLPAVLIAIAGLLYKKRKYHPLPSDNENQWNDPNIQVNPVDGSQLFDEKGQQDTPDEEPEHPIRKLVLNLEKEADKNGYGRKSYETIEDWFIRLKLKPDELELYQKVRYGQSKLTNKEHQKLKKIIQKVKKQLQGH